MGEPGIGFSSSDQQVGNKDQEVARKRAFQKQLFFPWGKFKSVLSNDI
jgi:hypothetical protein